MTRSLSPALTMLLLAGPVFAQQAPSAATDAKALAAPLPDEATLPPDEPSLEEAWLAEEGVDFCGGDESIVDDAYAALYDGRVVEAEASLVEALQAGEVEGWQRPYALVTLAEAQLRLGKLWAAAHNYARALKVDERLAGDAARVGLGTALFLQHRRRPALEIGREAAARACATRFEELECYAARLLVAEATRDPEERARSLAEARRLRSSPDLAPEGFDLVDARFEVTSAPAAVVARSE